MTGELVTEMDADSSATEMDADSSAQQVGGSGEPDGDVRRQLLDEPSGGLGGINLILGSGFRVC